MKLTLPAYLGRIAFSALAALIGVVFALPLIWFLFAPFNAKAELGLAIPDPWTLSNFVTVFQNNFAVRALWNSLIQSVGGVILVGAAATLAAYALSRSSIPGKGAVTYILLLFSSVVSGSAAMVPIFLIVSAAGLIDTHLAVILVFAGGLLPPPCSSCATSSTPSPNPMRRVRWWPERLPCRPSSMSPCR